ncbi:glycosyltransferase family 4 protein [Mesorhizobium sp. ISC25]|uniref:glycosyltransferase family 4 protein n=1 Tax=Mesorhizobium sp. ISC25 TaxID=3077335 RepID=UPI0035E2BD66
MLDHADILVCPSEFVRADLVDNFGVEPARTRIVPYAVAPSWFDIAPRPQRGRVLFAGTADLRKGIHIFGQASQMLMKAGDHYEFRVAGEVSPRIRARPEVGALTFLGRVPRDKVHIEFQRADVLVLPSLVEGSAGVTYEALAAGVPTVTTRAAGSVVRHGTDGLIVEEGSPLALAEAIAKIVSDRALRDRMSLSARDHARTFSWERYRQRLVTAVLGERAAGSFSSDEDVHDS